MSDGFKIDVIIKTLYQLHERIASKKGTDVNFS